MVADLITAGIAGNTLTVLDWAEWMTSREPADLLTMHRSMLAATQAVRNGDLAGAEAMLMAQAISLNIVFADLARGAHVARFVDHFDRFMRLALKAQSQSRATIETLGMMKNPTVFARQANIAAGPQQVNNGIVDRGFARPGIQEPTPNKLLEAHDQRLDKGASGKASAGNSSLEAMEALDRTPHTRGEGASLRERVPRRRSAAVPRPRQTAGRVAPSPA